MGRPPKPWVWKARKCYAATVRGKREVLAEGTDAAAKARAERELHRLLAMGPEEAAPLKELASTVPAILGRYFDHVAETFQADTVKLYKRRLREFRDHCGKLSVADLKPRHVQEWTASRAWNSSTARTATVIVASAFSWAAKQGYIATSPIAGMDKPRATRRKNIPTADDVAKLLAAEMTPAFRDFFVAVRMTGCRPGEAAKVEAKDFDAEAGTWTIHGKTTRKTGQMRVVVLPDPVIAICERLARVHPEGPLFRNTRGRKWLAGAYGDYLLQLRKRLGLGPEVVAYGLRHLFATDALEQGVPIATVAELLGHTSTLTISRNYSHLAKRTSHLRDAVRKIRPED